MPKCARSLGVIPARAHSTRFPFKVIAKIKGKPMLQYVWENANRSSLERVLIATDHPEIEVVAKSFGAEVVMTPSDLPSGTERVAFVAKNTDAELVVALQADEPLLKADAINQLLEVFEKNETAGMVTLAVRRRSFVEFRNPNIVKLAMSDAGRALYFSRAPLVADAEGGFLKHVGVYGYRRDILLAFSEKPTSQLERAERLEQLRALENGIPIHVAVIREDTIAVDEPGDIQRVESAMEFSRMSPNL